MGMGLKHPFMIEQIPTVPANTAGFRAIGDVNADDYDRVVIPGIEALLARQDHINFLLVLDTTLSDFTIGAIARDLGVGLKHFSKWRKMAIVTDSKAIEIITNAFSYVTPGEAKGFPHHKLDEAILWVSS